MLRLAVLSLLCLPLAGCAQNASPAPQPRFYVGLGVYGSEYQPIGWRTLPPTRVPVQLTVGYQLRPRLAVQAALAYHGASYQYANVSSYGSPGAPNAFFSYDGRSTQRSAAVSLLARYTLTRQLARRFQADLLGGFTLEHRASRDMGTYTEYQQGLITPSPYDNRTSASDPLLTVGPSVRCRVARRLEAVLDVTWDLVLDTSHPPVVTAITSAGALGLRYRFGRS